MARLEPWPQLVGEFSCRFCCRCSSKQHSVQLKEAVQALPVPILFSQLRNAVKLQSNDYINGSGCASKAQSLFHP